LLMVSMLSALRAIFLIFYSFRMSPFILSRTIISIFTYFAS
jgi:hypothetical protein